MSQQELLKTIVAALGGAGIDYMVSGSIVSSLQGEPRATHDIDIVVTLDASAAKRLTEALPGSHYYLDEDRMLEAIERRTMFNLIDPASGYKVDFWILTDEQFDISRFSRKHETDLAGIRIAVSSPEDTILAKLRWAKLSGGSEKQFTDALRVYEVQYGNLDIAYLRDWAERLGIADLLEKLTEQAEVV
ncbi:MAG: hypothetical protein Q7T82_04705 [Armatimonadota bacterium]|nr:hypothetical protein [Armatimonadota bacterium]